MYQGLKVLAVIPARQGSKGLPDKNIRLLAGKPLLSHTIAAARESGVFDRIILSTDGEEIARVGREAGAEVPFMRPADLASDEARGIDVLHHVLEWLEQRGELFDCVMYLQPTSPLRTAVDIVESLKILVAREAQAVVSVCEMEHHPWWANTLPEDGCMKDFFAKDISTRRQDLPRYYRLNGAIYLARWEFIRYRDSWYGEKTYAYIMPRERSVDIDDELDFKLAEILMFSRISNEELNQKV